MKERSITDILKGFQKVELEDLGTILGQEFSPRLRKAQLVEKLTAYLTEKPGRWLSHLPERDLRLLKDLVHAGPGKVQYMDRCTYPSILEVSGLVDVDDSGDQFHKVWVRREVYDIVAPHIDKAIRKGEKSGRFEVERVGMGYLNLYGILPVDRFVDLALDWYESAYGQDYDTLVRLLQESPLIKVCRYTDAHGDYLCSPCISEAEEIFQLREEMDMEENDYRSFAPEEALEAGSGAPYFAVGLQTPEGLALTESLKRIGYSGFDLVKVQHDIWVESQLPFDNEALFYPLSDKEELIASDDVYYACMEAIVNYANRVPKWAMNGYSALEKDYLILETPPRELPGEEHLADVEYPEWTMPHPTISEGYTDLIETDDALDRLSELMPKGFPFGLAIPHVAPDDPCPCGSGLRYSRCHGKILN